MIADIIDRNVVVGLADSPGEAGAGRRDRPEAEMLQCLGGADVERIRNHKAVAFVQLAKTGALVGGWQWHRSLPCCRCAAGDCEARARPRAIVAANVSTIMFPRKTRRLVSPTLSRI